MTTTCRAAAVFSVLAIALNAQAADSSAGGMDMKGAKHKSDQQLIQSAMKAGPASISAKATIVAMNGDGSLRTLRKGDNGFTCMPDSGTAPGPDSMCLDAAAMNWLGALVQHQPPAPNTVGFIYMLAGGTDASNTDPYAAKPAPGQKWIRTGPHVMVVGADASFYAAYPSSADPDTKVPYVMWGGTPYQHLMAPVK